MQHRAGPSLGLKHWASSDPSEVPGASAECDGAHGLQGHLQYGLDKHSAVKRTGSSVPMLAEDLGTGPGTSQLSAADICGQSTQEAASQGPLARRQEAVQQAPVQEGADGDLSRRTLTASNRAASSGQQHKLLHLCSYRMARQHLHTSEAPDAVSPQSDGAQQQSQILRHRDRHRLSAGGQHREIMSLGKHSSGRVSPEQPALLHVRWPSGICPQQPISQPLSVGSALAKSAHSDHHLKLKSLGLIAILPNIIKPSLSVKAASAVEFTSRRLSMQDMLHQTVEQVAACTVQMQEQSLQQQEIQKALQAMTCKCIAMLDHSISTAFQQQCHSSLWVCKQAIVMYMGCKVFGNVWLILAWLSAQSIDVLLSGQVMYHPSQPGVFVTEE